MSRILVIDPDALEWSLSLSAEERLRQANAAFRLFHDLHQPFSKPITRGFLSLEELHRFEEENSLPG